jgi:hypothetical protein
MGRAIIGWREGIEADASGMMKRATEQIARRLFL